MYLSRWGWVSCALFNFYRLSGLELKVMRGCVCTYIIISLTTLVYISVSYTTHCMITFDHVTRLASKQRLNKFPNIRIHNFNKIRRHWGRNFEVSAAGTTLYRLVAPYKVLKVWNSFMISNRCRYFFVSSWYFSDRKQRYPGKNVR